MKVIKNPEPGKWYDMDCRPEIRKGSSCCIVVFSCDAAYSDEPGEEGFPMNFFAIGAFNRDGSAFRQDRQCDARPSSYAWMIVTDSPTALRIKALK